MEQIRNTVALLLWSLHLCSCRPPVKEQVSRPAPILPAAVRTNLSAINDVPQSGEPCHIQMAHSQVGTVEVGGNNAGPQVEEYLASVGFKKGAPWCGAAIHFCYRQCDRVLTPERSFALAASWHPKSRRVWERSGWKPDTADSFHRITRNGDHGALWYTSLNPPRIGHTFLVYDENEKYVYTLEGNTGAESGSRDGDGFYARKRLKKSVYCFSRW